MNEQVTLISISATGNSFDRIATEKKNTVFCDEMSISQREFYEATSRGLKAEYKLKIWSQEYNGETNAEYGADKDGNPKKFQIYRTFKNGDMMELYLASED